MSKYPNRGTEAQESVLVRVEQALREKAQTGRASEMRHGLVAQVVNAVPPMSESLHHTLWTRILTKEAQQRRHKVAGRVWAWPVTVRRFASATLAALLVLAFALVVTQTSVVNWDGIFGGLAGGGERPTAEDFDALAEAINGAPGPRTVVTYLRRASPIAERVHYRTVPIDPVEGASLSVIYKAVDAILPPDGYVDLVMPAAQESDAARHVRAAMERSLFHLYQASGQVATEGYGALERSAYLAGPEDATPEPIGARFEGGVELVAGGVLDEPQAGMPLRVALDWRVQEPLSESLMVFVHLQRGEFELVAQRDAVPGNGLFPVEQWRPGELVRDQFALLLPLDLPAGEYEVRVGIYDATTQRRYSLAESGQGTYVVLGNWVLASSTPGEQS